MNDRKYSIAVLISGGGTTLRNLLQHRDSGKLDVDFRLVISSNREAIGNAIASDASIPVRVFDYRDFPDAETISAKIFAACREAAVDLVVLGGFLRRLTIPGDFENRVVNIHPSLIPAHCGAGMYGRRVHQSVIRAGDRQSGCTVHYVDNQYDHGPVIAQQQVPVRADDTPETLAARVFEAECELYPAVINSLAEGRSLSTPDP